MTRDALEEAWKAMCGDISDLNWESILNEIPSNQTLVTPQKDFSFQSAPTMSSAPTSTTSTSQKSTKVRKCGNVIAPHICGTVLDTERNQQLKAKKPPRKKPTPKPEVALPPPPPPSPSRCTPASSASGSIVTFPDYNPDHSLAFILDSFDSLISPQIPYPLSATQSNIALRRSLYRKMFQEEAFKILHSSHIPLTSVDQLLAVVYAATAKCGISLA